MDDEEKKTGAGGQEPERLGPYRIEQEIPRARDGEEGLYLATHEPTGAVAMLVDCGAGKGEPPPEDLQVLLSVSASLRYYALHVLRTRWSRAPDRQSVESLLFTFVSVLAAVRRMARVMPDIREPRPRWHLGVGVAGAAAVCLLLLALVWRVSVSSSPSAPPAHLETPDPFTSTGSAATAPQAQPVLARPMPKEPFKGQKRPPCIRYTEVELIGACWMPHRLKAPCPDAIFEHQGECYAPVFLIPPPPQAVEP
jgi:hypothetical protein